MMESTEMEISEIESLPAAPDSENSNQSGDIFGEEELIEVIEVPEAGAEEEIPPDSARAAPLPELRHDDVDSDVSDTEEAYLEPNVIILEAETDGTESELQDLDDASSVHSDLPSDPGSRPLTPAFLDRPGNPDLAERPPTPRPLSDLSDPSPLNESAADFRSPKKVRASVVAARLAEKSGGGEEEGDDEEAECCPICFESWNNSGNHRLSSLKCGHLFGQSCIEKWLKGQGGKCPQCNTKAHRKDIRVIYAKALRTVDTAERDDALKQLETERVARKKAEMEAAQSRLRYQMALDECNRLKHELDRQRQQLQHSRQTPGCSTSISSQLPNAESASTPKSVLYHMDRNIKIWEAGGCRVMAYAEHLATLCISQPSSSPLFPGFGVKKLSALDFKTSQYVSIHSKAVRDLTFNPAAPDGILLSCSLDKTVKMTSLLSNTVVQTYNCTMPLWSCAWNTDDRNYFYAGQQNGAVCVFDVRNTSDSVEQINTEGSRSPIASLQYIPQNIGHTFSPGGLVVGQLDRSTFYERKNESYKCHVLPIEAALTSLCVEPETRHVLSTHRPSARSPSVRHQMYELTCRNTSSDPVAMEMTCGCSSIHTFYGGSTAKLLSRTRLLANPSDHTSLLVAAGDEASQTVNIWDAGNGLLKQKLRVNAPVLDVCPLTVNDQHFLAALTDKQVVLFHSRSK